MTRYDTSKFTEQGQRRVYVEVEAADFRRSWG